MKPEKPCYLADITYGCGELRLESCNSTRPVNEKVRQLPTAAEKISIASLVYYDLSNAK